MRAKKETPSLNQDDIKVGATKRLEKYKNLTFFEQYAMFMGVAQILEFGLKKLLESKFD